MTFNENDFYPVFEGMGRRQTSRKPDGATHAAPISKKDDAPNPILSKETRLKAQRSGARIKDFTQKSIIREFETFYEEGLI